MRRYYSAILLLLILAGAPIFAQSVRPSQNVPDVYVAANNSFVITVPNLTKVAVGDPRAVSASVVSPTEVLIQGSSSVSKPDGKLNFATSNVFVWSGDRRYVYRVVVIENDESASYPYGVDRIDVEPNRIIFRGASNNVDRTKAECRIMCESLGLKYEIKVEALQFVGAMTAAAGVSREVIDDAVKRNLVVVGMTLDDLKHSRGELPPPYRSDASTSGVIDYYNLEDVIVGVMNGIVIEADKLNSISEELIQTAKENSLIMAGMTDSQVFSILGQPPVSPIVKEENKTIVREYAYPTMRVITRDGIVESVSSNHPLIPSSITPQKIDLGTTVSATGQTLVMRAYRLQYISGADLEKNLSLLSKAWGTSIGFTTGYTTDGLFAIVSDTATISIVDGLVILWDRPMTQAPIAIQETKYTIPEGRQWDGIARVWQVIPAREVGFLMARFNNSVSEARRKNVADEINRSISTLPVIPFASPLSMNLSGATLTVTGVPEQVSIIKNILEGMIPDIIGKDLNSAVAQGILLPGMTKQQIEAARGVKLDAGRRVELSNGSIGWLYELGDRAVLLNEDILSEERMYPAGDAVRNAKSEKKLIRYLLRSDVESILGQTPKRITRREDGITVVNYDFGEALYWNDRLESMNGLAGSEMQRLGISVSVPSTDGVDFQLLTPEEQQTVIRRGVVMTGMTERDVARVVGQAPFNIKPGTLPNEKIYVYSDYEVTFSDGIASKVTSIGEGTPRIIALRSRRASDMVSLILSSFSNMSEVGLTADTVSNRLIVRATNDKFIEIERFSKAMDQQEVPQVLIEAKFVEMNRQAAKQLGVEWGLSTQADGGNKPFVGFGGSSSRTDAQTQPAAGVVTGTTGSGGTNQTISLGGDAGMLLGMFGGNGFSFGGLRYANVDVMVSALESRGDAEVLSSPRIVTLNNQNASLKSIETVYDVTTTQTIDPLTGLTTFSTTTSPKDVGIELKVNPTIGQDGVISLDIDATVSRVVRTHNYGVGSNVIIINETSERNSKSRVMVRTGTPLVIGGLSSRDSTRTEQKVPFFGNIPILGNLFKSQSKVGTDVDLLIFLTARIAPPDGTISSLDQVLSAPRPQIQNPQTNIELQTAPSAGLTR